MRASSRFAVLGMLAGLGLAGCVAYPTGPDTYTYAPAPAPYPYYAPTASFFYYDGPRYYSGRRYYAPGRYHRPQYFNGPRHYGPGPRHYGQGPRHYDGHRR